MSRVVLLVIGLMVLAGKTYAATISYGKGEVGLRIPYVDVSKRMKASPVLVRFPRNVHTISPHWLVKIEPADKRKPNYSVLKMTPLFKKGTQRITFVLENRETINVKVSVYVAGTDADLDFEFKPRKTVSKSKKSGVAVTELNFMRSVLSGSTVMGYKISNVKKSFRCRKVWGVTGKVYKTYTGPDYKAYVMRVKNDSRKKRYEFLPHEVYFDNQDLSRSLIVHTTSKVLGNAKKGPRWIWVSVVGPPNLNLLNGHICDGLGQLKELKGV